jgi:transposase
VTEIICGVDVAAEALDARIRGNGDPWQRFARTGEGIAALAAFCQAHGVTLVAMEATGGYEQLPFGLLWAAGIPCAIVNPRSVRRFAEAMGLLEKTDRLDAGVIAWYAAAKGIRPRPPASATQQRLTALVTRLRQLTEARVAQGNQRALLREPDVLASIDALVALLAAQIRAFETKIAALIEADPLWAALDREFRTIKGVADRTVARLAAHLPEIGTLSNKAVAKLAGLAPIARDSGTHSGRRPVRAGRESIRSILFVVADLVRRYDPGFAAFHRKLTAAGKPRKVIRIAIARKLLVRLNAKARDVRANLTPAA